MLQPSPGPGEKTCKKCGLIKPLHQFHAASAMRDGHRNECRTCWRAVCRARYRKDPKRAIANVQKWREENPDKYKAWLKRNREENKEKRREQSRRTHLHRKYGLTQNLFEALVSAQLGNCAICGANEDLNLHVDHDHVTEKVRGLLCGKCNKAIGLLNDNPETLRVAANYLERAKSFYAGTY